MTVTMSVWKLLLLTFSVVWGMLVIWNFSNTAVGEALPLALAAWIIPIAAL